MKELIYDKRTRVKIPENADELTGRQFIELAGILHSKVNGLKARLKALKALSSKSAIGFYLMMDEVKLRCIDFTDWVFEDWAVTRQIIPKYRGFYGPKANLENITLAEFYFSEKYYADLVQNSTDEALDNLVSVLYRVPKAGYDKHKDLEGDVRAVFNSNACEYYARKIKRWRKPVKQAILLWYDACRKKIADDNPDIFSSSSAGTEGDNDADMFGILRSLAGGKYGDFEKVEKMYLGTALLEMNFMLKENERLKAELEKH